MDALEECSIGEGQDTSLSVLYVDIVQEVGLISVATARKTSQALLRPVHDLLHTIEI